MKRCMAIALLLVTGAAAPAMAAGPYQVTHQAYGCVDPRATLALYGADGPNHTPDWYAAVRLEGRCYSLTPAMRLDVVLERDRLALIRRLPTRASDPQIYVRASDIRGFHGLAQAASGQEAASGRDAPAGDPAGTAPAVGAAPGTAIAANVAPQPPASAGGSENSPTQAPAPSAAGSADPAMSTVSAAPPTTTARVPPMGNTDEPGTPTDAAAAGPGAGTNDPSASVVVAAPATSAPVPFPSTAAPAVADAAPPVWPPRTVARTANYGWLVAILVMLLMVVSVGSAWVVAHRRRHFAHVEDDWPPTERHASSAVPSEPVLPVPPPQEFRTLCSEALELAGWSTKIAFPGDGTGPDIVGRREGVLLAIRCRPSAVPIGSEMVSEAALMGARQPGSLVLLVSNAPFSEPAKAEAIRQRVHLLHDTELSAFVG